MSEDDMLERSRALDYVTLQGLSTLTGCEASYLDVLFMKELVDNGLDASEEAKPQIEIEFDKKDNFLTLTVKDKGTGINPSHIKKITDYGRLYSTKYYNKIPKRGALGNAFKVLMGAPYALAAETRVTLKNPIRVRSRSKEYNIELQIDELHEEVTPVIDEGEAEVEGTEVSLTLPIFGDRWGWKGEYVDLLRGYALFNPEADLSLTLIREGISIPYLLDFQSVGERERRFKGRQSIHWHRKAEFQQLVWAKIRAISKGEKDEPIGKLVGRFSGLSGYNRINKVLKEAFAEEGVPNLSDLASREDLTASLFDAMKSASTEPKPYVLGEIGEKAIRERSTQIFGKFKEFRYGIKKGVHDEGSMRTPYVIEVAVGILPESLGIKRAIYVGINNSPCLYRNPFDRCYLEWSQKKGEEKREYGIRALLGKYGIKEEEPVVVIVHLTSPGVEYINYGKSEINTEPFRKPLAQTLYKTCKFYYHHKRGGSSRRVGQMSRARIHLIKEILRRDEMVKRLGSIPIDERTTQQGLFYKIRKEMGGKIGIKRKSFISAIADECEKIGRKRNELGILAAVRAEMYFRGEVYPVSLENIKGLAEMGSDILLIEKEGIALALEPYARPKGVAIVNSRGFIVEYANDLINLSRQYNANIFQLTDQDASGLLISWKAQEIPRLGVDIEAILRLGLRYDDVAENYDPPKNHYEALPSDIKPLVKDKRVEIDSILAEIGPERLWNYLETRMSEISPKRDLTRSIDLTINLPLEITTPIAKISERLKTRGVQRRRAIEARLRDWRGGFIDIPEFEKQLQAEITETIAEDRSTKELAEELQKLINTHLEKFSENED